MFGGIGPLVFSRVRPCHVEGVIFAWLSMMYWAFILFMSPRLLGTRSMWSERLSYWSGWVWNVAMALGFIGILTGGTPRAASTLSSSGPSTSLSSSSSP